MTHNNVVSLHKDSKYMSIVVKRGLSAYKTRAAEVNVKR